MIQRAEPRKVMRFVEEHFGVLRRLYRAQLTEQFISATAFDEVSRRAGNTVTRRLLEYRIVREAGVDFRLAQEVSSYLGFLIQEFKPLLPEQLRGYHASIEDMHDRLTTGKALMPAQRVLRLGHLYDEVQQFLDRIATNTQSLLQRTAALKVNRDQRRYADRVREARLLIEEYIEPLNNIIDLNNDNSIAALLQRIGRSVNHDRLRIHPPIVTDAYEQLYRLLLQVDGILQREADILRRELMPLLERIKRESEVMNGWITFLGQPLLHPVPRIGQRHRVEVFGSSSVAELNMYVEQFAGRLEPTVITLSPTTWENLLPPFQPYMYRRRLEEALPISDFFGWCADQVSDTATERQEHRFFKLTSLLFSDQAGYRITYGDRRRPLRIGATQFTVPTIHVAK